MKATFRIKKYQITVQNRNIETPVRFALLADLHGVSFGRDNSDLIAALRRAKPDAVLIAGDMLVTRDYDTKDTAFSLISELVRYFPVYYSLGNHEYKMYLHPVHREVYLEYEKELRALGVHFLRNAHEQVTVSNCPFCIYGLELPVRFYHKPNSPKLTRNQMIHLIGKPAKDSVNILLAHNPKYGNAYFEWGADLTLCGHYHGGVLRFSENVGLASPQYLFLPPYCCGKFEKNDKVMIVSAGLGDHSLPLRIHNPRELILIDVQKSSF